MTTKKPVLKLLGHSGNAFSILARAEKIAKENNMNWEQIKLEATSGEYDTVLKTMLKYFDVE